MKNKENRPQGKSVTHEQGKRTTVIANRGPRLQVKVLGNPKGQDTINTKNRI
jgi:hypothetical protein